MSLLNEAINGALREHDVAQVGMAGSSPAADALRSLLAPKAVQAGLAPDDTLVEPDALQELVSRLEHAGYGEIIGSWIGECGNGATCRATAVYPARCFCKSWRDCCRRSSIASHLMASAPCRCCPIACELLAKQNTANTR